MGKIQTYFIYIYKRITGKVVNECVKRECHERTTRLNDGNFYPGSPPIVYFSAFQFSSLYIYLLSRYLPFPLALNFHFLFFFNDKSHSLCFTLFTFQSLDLIFPSLLSLFFQPYFFTILYNSPLNYCIICIHVCVQT